MPGVRPIVGVVVALALLWVLAWWRSEPPESKHQLMVAPVMLNPAIFETSPDIRRYIKIIEEPVGPWKVYSDHTLEKAVGTIPAGTRLPLLSIEIDPDYVGDLPFPSLKIAYPQGPEGTGWISSLMTTGFIYLEDHQMGESRGEIKFHIHDPDWEGA